MPKLVGRIRRLPRATPKAEPAAAAPLPQAQSHLDQNLHRLANASQLGLLLLAVFGYFYTVLPVYQKSLLDEEIAKKTIELRAMESRVTQAQELLQARESELSGMNKRLSELRSAADNARRGLGIAQAEVGKLRGTVDSQYAQLVPRLLRDFQSLAVSSCKASATYDGGFSECVETKVLTSPVLVAMSLEDKSKLLQIVREQSPGIHKSWAAFSNTIETRKQEVERKKTEALQNCEQLKATEDYKDKIKKISIDYQCSSELSRATSDSFKIQIDEMFSSDKIISPEPLTIAREFLRR